MKRVWTTGDERTLAEMWNRGCDQTEIGAALGRTALAVNSRVGQRRAALGLMLHKSPGLKAGQRKPIVRELELAITRAQAATGRRRGSIITEFKLYLFAEGRRNKKSAIEDLGGMAEVKTALKFGESRSDHKPKKRAA